MNDQYNSSKARSLSLCIVFLVFILGLFIATIVKKDTEFSENENRVLQQKPEFSFDALLSKEYQDEYDKYLADQFIGRNQWIQTKVTAERILQKKDINGTYFAKDNYLIATHQKTDVNQELVDRNIRYMKKFVEQYKDQVNINVLIPPTSSYVLRDGIPANAPEYDQDKMIQDIKDAVGDEHFTDLRKTFDDHKNEYIYYRTDHHWTTLGAYYAYAQWANKTGKVPYGKDDFTTEDVSKDFKGTTFSKVSMAPEEDTITLYNLKSNPKITLQRKEDKEPKDSLYDMSKLKEKDKYSVFLGGNAAYEEIHNDSAEGGTLLVIKDSFSHSFLPFAANHYKRIIVLDYRYLNPQDSTKQMIEKENVDDVLILYNTMNFAEDTNLNKLLK